MALFEVNFTVNLPYCNFFANISSLSQYSIVTFFGKFFVANTMKSSAKAKPQIILMTQNFLDDFVDPSMYPENPAKAGGAARGDMDPVTVLKILRMGEGG